MPSKPAESSALQWRLSRLDALMMAVVVIAISSSGPVIALCAAPVLAMAVWRCIFAAGLTLPFALRNHGFSSLTKDQIRGCAFAGLALAIHFALWIPSVRLTSVANSVALVATQPIWMLLMSKRLGTHIPRKVWWGIVVAFTGVLLVVNVDFGISTQALIGDAMALASAVAAGAYLMIGGHVRATVPNSVYTVIVYAVSAVSIAVVAVSIGTPLWGFSRRDWLLIGVLTLGAQLLGHSLMSRLMETTTPAIVGIAVLFEPPGAAIFAAILLKQSIPLTALIGMGVILFGLGIVVWQSNNATVIDAI
ncbi:MAG: DMT family transporter [Actinomycetes bacterium]